MNCVFDPLNGARIFTVGEPSSVDWPLAVPTKALIWSFILKQHRE